MASPPRQPTGTQSTPSVGHSPPTEAQDDFSADFERRRRPIVRSGPVDSSPKNSITATARPKRTRTSTELSPNALGDLEGSARGDPGALPERVNWRYEQSGKKFYLGGELAFIDRGRVLQTPFENKEIIRDLIDIQVERGSTAVVVAGSERFRREAWLQATVAGLEVKGYRPTEREAQLPGILQRQFGTESRGAAWPQAIDEGGIERPPPPTRLELMEDDGREPEPEPPVPDPRLRSGRLIEHGEAHYQFDPRKPLSYFVKLETPAGEVMQWGADLARAVRQSLSGARTGDDVVVRHLGENPITVGRQVRNERGEVVRKEEVKAWLNQWSVERVDFLRDRARLAEIVRDPGIDTPTALRQRPELKGTYEELDIAREMAPRLYADKQDQQRFVNRLRTALADEIQRGEPLSATRSRNRSREARPDEPRTPRQVQERMLS